MARDKPLFVAGLDRLSPQSRHYRFLAGLARFTAEQLRMLTEVDQERHVCWVAVTADGRAGIGVARYSLPEDSRRSADRAVTTIDEWQRRGVTARLLAPLALTAGERGVRRFIAEFAPDNTAILGLLRAAGGEQMDDTRWRLRVEDALAWSAARFV